MRLITLNTWGGRVLQPLLTFLADKKDDTDIFCFQEIYNKAKGKEPEDYGGTPHLDIFTKLVAALPEHTAYFRPAWKDYFGQAIFVKKGINILEEGDVMVFKNNNPVPARGTHSRNLHFVTVTEQEKQYTIANIHGLWNGQGKSDSPDRIQQSKNIKAFLNAIPGAKILCGDFNLLPDTESIKILEEGMENLITTNNITSTRTSLYTKDIKFADYILTSPEVIVNSFKVLPEEVSDHAALQLDFS